jgi:hypothetical protein
MKKFTLIALAIMASATSFAQTTLWNGEDKEVESKGDVWDRCNPEVVENPNKDAVNSSDKCLKITITGKEWDNGSLAFGLPAETSFASKRLSLKIKKADNTNVKVELTCKDGNDKTYKKVATWYDGAGEWRKLYFDFSTNDNVDTPIEIAIYPTTDNVEGSKEVYVDDIQIENLPKVGDKALTEITDGSLTGDIQLNGTWLKGVCQNVEGDWFEVKYDDFSTLNAKLSENVTSIDMRTAATKDVDINQFFKNPNTLVYADKAYVHNNIIVNGNAESVVLTDDYAFSCPEAFIATTVSLKRTVQGGINSFVLPFWVNANDLKSKSLATYSSADNNEVVFTKVTEVGANTPFITVGYNGEENKLTWSNKGFVATPTEFTAPFKGVYAPQSAKGLYGINADGNLQIGSEKATINAFHAFYQAAEGQTAPAKISFEGEATGINNVAATTVANGAVYDLSGRRVAEKLAGASLVKGIYVVNGKKVVVK